MSIQYAHYLYLSGFFNISSIRFLFTLVLAGFYLDCFVRLCTPDSSLSVYLLYLSLQVGRFQFFFQTVSDFLSQTLFSSQQILLLSSFPLNFFVLSSPAPGHTLDSLYLYLRVFVQILVVEPHAPHVRSGTVKRLTVATGLVSSSLLSQVIRYSNRTTIK